jgi:hypothetical protein
MAQLPDIFDLFGDVDTAISYYKGLFPATTLNDDLIIEYMTVAFTKIEPVFGQIRNYKLTEDSVRNEYIKRSVCFEANSISAANNEGTVVDGGLNANAYDGKTVTQEKLEDVSTSYASDSNSGGMGDTSLKDTLGLLSTDAAILLSRFIQKTYGMGTPYVVPFGGRIVI